MFNVSKFKKLKLKSYKINEELKEYTTFNIGGRCLALVIVQNIKELKKTIKFCVKQNLKYFVLGCGSNILFEDAGFNGIVIKISENFCKKTVKIYKNNKTNHFLLKVGAGEKLFNLNTFCAQNGLTGLEWSYGIPASVGGAICSNAGSFGKDISMIIKSVKVLYIKKILCFKFIKIKTLKKKQCNFSYRNSIFKNKKYIILSVALLLNKDSPQSICFNMKQYLNQKKQTQPLGTKNAGCVFKNGQNYKIAELIQNLNLKGKSVGNAQISTKHSNFIVNNSNASCQNVKDLINYIQIKVQKEYGINPELEIELIKEGE